jgi:hypothetical protein
MVDANDNRQVTALSERKERMSAVGPKAAVSLQRG